MKYVNRKIFKIDIDDISIISVLKKIKQNEILFIVTPNLDHHKKIYENHSLIRIYNSADLILNDSRVLFFFTKFFKKKLVNTVRGSDLTELILKNSLKKKFLIFGNLINLEILKKIYPSNEFFQIKASFNKKRVKNDVLNILNYINKKNIDYIMLCGGAPYSEKIGYFLKKKNICSNILAVGSSINFIIGKTKRAPKIISKIGLEWFYRAIIEPRLILRYISDLKYFYYIFKNL